MTEQDYTFDINNIITKSDVRNFISNLLFENEILKDKINIAFRKILGNTFTLF